MNVLNISLFTLTIGNFQFKPSLTPTVLIVITLYGLISLGLWQIDRAEYKEKLENMIAERTQMQPIDMGLVPRDPEKKLYLPVTVNGFYDSSRNFLLDNRVLDTQVGYNVYTPFRLDTGTAILINRGWLALGSNRQTLPVFKTETRNYRLEGILLNPPVTNVLGYEIIENYSNWPAVVQTINLQEIEKQLGYTLNPMVIILNKQSPSGFKREDKAIKLNMSSDKHIGYAVTWFLCALVLSLISLTISTKRIIKL